MTSYSFVRKTCMLALTAMLFSTQTIGFAFAEDVVSSDVPADTASLVADPAPVDTSATSSEATTSEVVVDTTAPMLAMLSPLTADAGVSTTFSIDYSDDTGVVACEMTVYTDSVDVVAMTLGDAASGTATASYTFADAGLASALVDCSDAAGNHTINPVVPILVLPASASEVVDTTAPMLGALSPLTADAGVSTSFSINYSDDTGVTACEMTVYGDSVDVVAMTLGDAASGTATVSYTFATAGLANTVVDCSDAAGNHTISPLTPVLVLSASTSSGSDSGSGSDSSVDVSTTSSDSGSTSGGSSSASSEVVSTPVTGGGIASPRILDEFGDKLVKTACPIGDIQYNQCGVVYYVDANNVRHPFISLGAFLTWFADERAVETISAEDLASLDLGTNIGYRPGSALVKFASSSTVYAVSLHGVLRPIASEEVATSLYGADWSNHVSELADALYGSFRVGDMVTSSVSFAVSSDKSIDPATMTLAQNM